MGSVKSHPLVKLIAALTFCPDQDLLPVYAEMEKIASPLEEKSDVFNFSEFTDYYQPEMGNNLLKQFIVFEKLVPAETLPALKLHTNDLEQKYSASGKRRINIDPGYICESKLVLATTKNYTHRIYLGEGIFGDVHLCYQKHGFRVQPWTYPDYQQPYVLEFFTRIRDRYMEKRHTSEN